MKLIYWKYSKYDKTNNTCIFLFTYDELLNLENYVYGFRKFSISILYLDILCKNTLVSK